MQAVDKIKYRSEQIQLKRYNYIPRTINFFNKVFERERSV